MAGATGRMGRAVRAAAGATPGLQLTALFDQGEGEGLVPRDEALAAADVVVDFTSSAASAELARLCAARGGPRLVIGSTGFTPKEGAEVETAAERIAIVKSGNFSLGVNVLLGLARHAAALLAADAYDAEILEAHHRRKVDAPSGTALMLGEAVAAGRGVSLAEHAVRARDGLTGPRGEGEIGFAVLRGGGVVGEHSVTFAAEDELITLAHSARDRSLFARGALAAARWVAERPPGLYDMQQVLGFQV